MHSKKNFSISRRAFYYSAFSSTLINSHSVKSDNNIDVLVIGAGLSGLYAANLLVNEGLKVLIIEGNNRLGGRIKSLRNLQGNPEAGGDSILGGYGRIRNLVKEYGLDLTDHALRRGLNKKEIVYGGGIIDKDKWPVHKLNFLPEGSKELFPGRKFFESVVKKNTPLDSFESWSDPSNKKYDVSVYQFLKDLGWSDQAIIQNYETNIGRGNSSHDCSILSWYFRVGWDQLQKEIDDVAYKVVGGNQTLIESMASTFPGDILLNKVVAAINQDKKRVEVICEDGSNFYAKRVINSMPLMPLRWVKFDPVITTPLLSAIKLLPSMKINKVFLDAKKPFWEEDGYSPAMWTDTDVGQVSILRQNHNNTDITGLIARIRGPLAEKLDRLGPELAAIKVIQEYEKVRPASKGNLSVVGYKSWAMDRFAGGTWTEWEPGQIHKFQESLSKPFGRVHFCGEHTALSNRGMEGAAESAERCAFEVLDLI